MKSSKKEKGFGAERRARKALNTANSYHEVHTTEITLYEAAERYLKDALQEHFNAKKLPPVAKWTAEIQKLTAERSGLNQHYNTLKDEVKEAEQIRKSIYSILRQEQCEQQPHKGQDMEL